MIVRPFLPDDLKDIALQPMQPKHAMFTQPEYGHDLANGGDAKSFDIGGKVIACIGAYKVWEGRAIAWALLSHDAGPFMAAITLYVRRYLRTGRFRRVEAYIDPAFPEAIRWAELLGFECEGLMKSFLPNGAPQFMYARTI